MAFVNEYISAEEIKKYDIDAISKRFIIGGIIPCDWTIDRERNMYLRKVASGREEFSHRSTWTFYWHDELLVVELDILGAEGQRGGPCSSHKKIRSFKLPPHLESKRDEILADLREALTAYKDGGIFATATTYTLTLDV